MKGTLNYEKMDEIFNNIFYLYHFNNSYCPSFNSYHFIVGFDCININK